MRSIGPSKIGKRIAVCRKRAGLSASRLSLEAGLARSHVAAIESGRNPRLTVETVEKLARVLNVRAGWLVDGLDSEA